MNDPNVSAILAQYNLATAKSLGQNFLWDGAVLEQIAQAANVIHVRVRDKNAADLQQIDPHQMRGI